ncbi:hypothetical protein [Lolliginicoccus levis]|nr:hypothetical protein [Lolliginicoccus levis]
MAPDRGRDRDDDTIVFGILPFGVLIKPSLGTLSTQGWSTTHLYEA